MTVNRVEGGIFTVMVIGIGDPYDPALNVSLAEQVGRSPGFFSDAPVVLDLKDCIGCTAAEDFASLKASLREHRLVAVGVQNASTLQQRAALATDLAAFPAAGGTQRRSGAAPAADSASQTRLVTQPVRSGTQIYARNGDLIVVAPVSAGAELIADGHVHVYGALRGRAIAGAKGDMAARIFVQRLEAELVAIAGRYVVSEAIAPEHHGRPVQVALVDDRLLITPGWNFEPGPA
jgi:septum site-determining protein MinC